ncbi:ricin-type beta-trefoil lectin domain protein [Streptomyces mexicanus]
MTLSPQPPARPSAAARRTGGAPEPDGTGPDAPDPHGTGPDAVEPDGAKRNGTAKAAGSRVVAGSGESSEETEARTVPDGPEPEPSPDGPGTEPAYDEVEAGAPGTASGARAVGRAASGAAGVAAATAALDGAAAAPEQAATSEQATTPDRATPSEQVATSEQTATPDRTTASEETATPDTTTSSEETAAAEKTAASKTQKKASAVTKSRLPAHLRTMTAAAGRRPAEAAPLARPGRAALVGAAVAGALLVSVPFLLLGGGDDHRPARSENAPGTVLGGEDGRSEPGAYSVASPDADKSPDAKTASPKGVHRSSTPNAPTAPASAKAGAEDDEPAGGKKDSGTSSATGTKKKSSGDSGGSSGSRATQHKPSTGSGTTTTGTTKPRLTLNGPVAFRGHQSGRCLDVPASQFTDGRPLQLWDCNGADAQKWRLASDGTIRSGGNASLCLDVAGANFNNGTTIQLAWCNGNIAQQFTLNERNDLVNTAVGMCVGSQGGDLHARIQLFTCNGQDNQKWSFA